MSCTCKFLVKTFIGTPYARIACVLYTGRVCLFPNTRHVRVDTHCPRHTLLQELNHVREKSLSLSASVSIPRNYKVIGDICESSFNPFVPSMNMQKRCQNEPTMLPYARRRFKRREIRFTDVSSFRARQIDVPDLLSANSESLVRGAIYTMCYYTIEKLRFIRYNQ